MTDKDNNDDNDENGVSEWSFPDVDSEDFTKEDDFTMENIRDENDIIANHNVTASVISQTESVHQEIKIIPDIDSEILMLKSDHEKKVRVINNVLEKLENPVALINDELLEILQDIIKKIAKRLIHKEIEADPHLIKIIIDDLSGLIKSKNGMVNVFLSEVDYKRLDSEGEHPSLMVQIESSLTEGDVVVKSNSAEIRGILSERIDLLTKVQHD